MHTKPLSASGLRAAFTRLTVSDDVNWEGGGKMGMQRDCTKRGHIGTFKLSEEESSSLKDIVS